jgi:hypothetical protein
MADRHNDAMDAQLESITALPGAGRYQLAFRSADGATVTAVVELAHDVLRTADTSLPQPWGDGSEARAAITAAVLALARARRAGNRTAALRDVAGGWDVSLGNVVLADGVPSCVAHGPMSAEEGWFVCPACGARAVLAADPGRNVGAGG